ncbi:type II secretion system F family protein [Altererythrobacter aurantiacus]|uniref:Type II secretion system F family protein n=1 Tax=Parapontixanthobacter aurantiacus TaxID=1463599 RepID=A0A844ZJY5_9SPHN|nr:type II secretion system F family protein [Parapontixanthobacter aurantiacus]MXO86009.1 type II secretion system F family protein [Parapontixanthobacter aurantiacus]
MIELFASNWILRGLVLLALFGLVAMVAYIVASYSSQRIRTARNLAQLSNERTAVQSGSLIGDNSQSAWAKLSEKIERGGLDLSDTSNDELRKKLRAAGYHSAAAPRIYTLVKLTLIFVVPGIFLLMASLSSDPPSLLTLYLVSAFLAVLGLYLPKLFIQAKADRRQTAIINAFPDSLDLMLVCVEAGLGLEAALDRVGREMAVSHPLISELFLQTTLLMRAGATREEALRKLGQNAGVDQIKSFATLLVQSDKLGTSMSQTLRVYSAEMREQRRMRAEEKAHRLPVLISIPLVVFMLPTMIGVLALPAVILALRDVIPAMTGG